MKVLKWLTKCAAVATATVIKLRQLDKSVGTKHGSSRLVRLNLLQQQAKIMHATQYYGEVRVGKQQFKVIFDSGSGALLVPGKKCDSPACESHTRYDGKLSKDAAAIGWADEPLKAVDDNSEDRDVKSISFAMGEVTGEYQRDRVCFGSGGGTCGLVDFMLMTEESDNPFKDAQWDGVLGLGLSLSDAPEFNVVPTLLQEAKQPQVFSYFLSGYSGALALGNSVVQAPYFKDRFTVPISVDGYWQFKIDDIIVDGKPTGLCDKKAGCQAAVDTGSSLLMGPSNMIAAITKKLEIDDKCSKQKLPAFGFLVSANGKQKKLEMSSEDYLDRDAKNCYLAMMSVRDTGRGPLLVLGYPFLRNYLTTFDYEKKELGFVDATTVKDLGNHEELKGIRPA